MSITIKQYIAACYQSHTFSTRYAKYTDNPTVLSVAKNVHGDIINTISEKQKQINLSITVNYSHKTINMKIP